MRMWDAAAPFVVAMVAMAILGLTSPIESAAEELGTAPSYDTWEDELFGEGEEPLLDDPDPSWGDEDPGQEEGIAPLFPPLSPWDLEEPGFEEPVLAEPDDGQMT